MCISIVGVDANEIIVPNLIYLHGDNLTSETVCYFFF